jgi:hypothetical protein
MIKTISIIIVGVSIFGLLFFMIVKRAMKKRIDYLVSKNNVKK